MGVDKIKQCNHMHYVPCQEPGPKGTFIHTSYMQAPDFPLVSMKLPVSKINVDLVIKV